MRNFDNNFHPIDNYKFYGWEGLIEMGELMMLITPQEFANYRTLANVTNADNNQNSCD